MFCSKCKNEGNYEQIFLVGHKLMAEMHLKQPGFTYSACSPFTKNKERIEKFMQTGNTNFIYETNLIKLVFSMIWLMAKKKI